MQEDFYGFNGVELDPEKLDEFQLHKETKNRDFEHALLTAIWLVSCGGLIIWVSQNGEIGAATPLLACMMCLGCFSPFAYFSAKAKDEQRLPNSLFNARQHKHVTGLGALVSIALLVFIGLAVYTGELFHPEFKIPEWFGYLTLLLVGSLLTALILAPHIGGVPSMSTVSVASRRIFSFLSVVI